MCDLTEAIYSPNDVVWVKLGPVWWPGRVCGEDEIPPEIMKDLRKTPIAIVKFFQEDSFEYVKSLSNIYHYHCTRKNEFIKKGLDMLRSKNRGAPSNMKLFPEDIVRAEVLTNGNPAILQNTIFLPEEKPAYTDIFYSKKTPKKLKSDVKKKQAPAKPNTPRLITHPRFLQLSCGQNTDYEVRERKQIPMRAECDEEDTSPPTLYSCTECDYTTTRLNVMVWHNKSHTRNYALPQVPGKGTKRKSTALVKLKERTFSSSPNIGPKAEDMESASAAKIPKKNGALKVGHLPKTPGRKKGSIATKKTPAQTTPHTKESNSTPRMPAQKGRRSSANKGDEIHKSLLEDWLEDDIELEESAVSDGSPDENAALADSSVMSNGSKSKSCFDFDDSEDHLVIDKSKFKPGRKIPRLLNKSALSTLAADDVVAIQDSTNAMEVDATIDSMPKYQSGVEDSMDGESSLSHSQTSQLQEMGVDNEIEIKTEEVPVNKVAIESMPPKKSRRNLKTEAIEKESAELQDQVDKLLNETSTPSVKLPDIPRSHKKAQLKAYQQQAEAEELAAQKATTEAEAFLKAATETEAAQPAIAEAEAVETAAAECEVAVEVDTAQKATVEAKTVQKVAAEPAQKVAFEEEADVKAETASNVTEQTTTIEREVAEKMLATQQNVEEQVTHNLHPETIDIEVSNIPLPSPQECPVTSEPVESSINVGVSKMVAENESLDEQSLTSPATESSKMLASDNVITQASSTNSAIVDQTPTSSTSSSYSAQPPTSVAGVVEASDTPVATDAKQVVKLATVCKTTKSLNATPLLRSGQPMYISPTNYKLLMNKLNMTTGQVSPSKTSTEPLKTIMTGGKSILCNMAQAKRMLANSQSSGSSPKVFILNLKKAGTTSATTATASTAPTSTVAGRSIDLANATTLRVTPNILQKSAAAQKAAAALAKTTGKNIVLDASTFQSLFQTQPQQLCKVQSQIVLPGATATAQVQAPSSSATVVTTPSQSGIMYIGDGGASVANSNGDCTSAVVSNSTTGQTIDYNYIVDSSGNLVQVDEPPTVHTPTKDKDILAKALENTDGLQTEMALSEAVTNSVLDACSVAQNTEMTYKTEAIYENLTLNTAPIMSAYETPSRVVAAVNVLAEASNEMANI